MKLSKNQYILHIARDTVSRDEAPDGSKMIELRRFHENRLVDLAKASQAYFRIIASPLGNTFAMLSSFASRHPSEAQKVNEAVGEWEKVKKILQELVKRTPATHSPSNPNGS